MDNIPMPVNLFDNQINDAKNITIIYKEQDKKNEGDDKNDN